MMTRPLFIQKIIIGLVALVFVASLSYLKWRQWHSESSVRQSSTSSTSSHASDQLTLTTQPVLPTPICPPYRTRVNNALAPMTCVFTIQADLKPAELLLHFKKTSGWSYESIDTITVVQQEGEKLAQQVLLSRQSDIPASQPDINYFFTEDLNFDGYNDLKLLTDAGATGNESYQIWFYHPASSRYGYNNEVSALSNIYADPTRHELHSSWDLGGGAETSQTYQWQNEKLVRIRYADIYFDDHNQIQVQGELINGKMITTTTTLPW